MPRWLLVAALAFTGVPGGADARPQVGSEPDSVRYEVRPSPADASGVVSSVRVTVKLPADARLEKAELVMPRAIPMGYGQQPYDSFVADVNATDRAGARARVARIEGPRWRVSTEGAPLATIDYIVDVAAMEQAILSGGDSAHARPSYLGLLGYAVFAFVDGLENRPIGLDARAPENRPEWPVFTTLAPQLPVASGAAAARAANFYALADSQILMGPGFRLARLKGAPDLFMAIHAEGEVDSTVMAPLAEEAYAALIRYFGSAPFPHFTLIFDYLKPMTPRHQYGFSMEHLESATFGAVDTAAPKSFATPRERAQFRYNVAHHIAHAWIPKRCAGEGYFPFRFELAPLIDTIWLSEGFGQYAAADALSDVLPVAAGAPSYLDTLVDARFVSTLAEMPAFLKEMPLVELSRLASFVYSEDFRTGRTVFSRGGLLARDIDRRIRSATGGRARLRDALRGLVAWSSRTGRPFRIDELPGIFRSDTGVDTADLFERHLAGMK